MLRRLSVGIILLALLSPLTEGQGVITVRRATAAASCTTADNGESWSVLWWFNGDNTSGGGGCSGSPCTSYAMDCYDAGTNPDGIEVCGTDDTPSFGDDATLTTGANLNDGCSTGNCYGFYMDNGGSNASYLDWTPDASIQAEDRGRLGMLIEIVTDSTTGNPNFWQTWTSTDKISMHQYGTTKVQNEYNDGTSRNTTCATNCFTNALGPVFFIEIAWETTLGGTSDGVELWIDGTKINEIDVELTDIGAQTIFRLGEAGTTDTGQFYIDTVVLVDDPTVDLYNVVCGDSLTCEGGQYGNYCN